MLITGKADEVVLQRVKNTLYVCMGSEYMHLHILGKNWVACTLNNIYFIPVFLK